jgi:hypothetical protein
MTDCLDAFKMGCDTCGSAPCCCGKGEHIVHDNRGDCIPLLGDPNKIFTHTCRRPVGGDKTVGAPQYELTVENPPDDIERNADGSPVVVNGEVVARTT